MALVCLILILGVLNLGLGFALAVYLGYAPSDMPNSGGPVLASQPDGAPRRAPGGQTPPASAEEMPGDDPAESSDAEYESWNEMAAGLSKLEQPEASDPSGKSLEMSISELNVAMVQASQRAVELDTRLRAIRGYSDLETIRRCVEELLDDCRTCLAEQGEAAETFRGRIGELKSLGEEIEMANLEQAAQIETIMGNLRQLDLDGDLEAANQRLLAELNSLRSIRHKIRDNYEMALMTIARHEDRIETIGTQLCSDTLTKLSNRIGLEATLWQWWRQDLHHSRQMSAVLFDLDRFGELNAQHGLAACDRILIEVAGLIQRQLNAADLLGRFAGQRFLAVRLDAEPGTAVQTAELIRQTIGKAVFLQGSTKISVTVSSGIIEVSPADTHESLLQRLETTLEHAKKAGGNCASRHNGTDIELVESPSLEPECQEIRI